MCLIRRANLFLGVSLDQIDDNQEEEILEIPESSGSELSIGVETFRPTIMGRPMMISLEEIYGVLTVIDEDVRRGPDNWEWLILLERWGRLGGLSVQIQSWFEISHYTDQVDFRTWLIEGSYMAISMGIPPGVLWEYYLFREFIGVSGFLAQKKA